MGDTGCAGNSSLFVVRSSNLASYTRYGFFATEGVGETGCAGYSSRMVVVPSNFTGDGAYALRTPLP